MNRRLHPRFRTPPACHGISIRRLDEDRFHLSGHAYDLSEGGVQFELDEPIKPGSEVGIMIDLPMGFDSGPGRAVFASGRIIWLSDADEQEEEPGPVRMAAAFTRFSREGDFERLMSYMTRSALRKAA